MLQVNVYYLPGLQQLTIISDDEIILYISERDAVNEDHAGNRHDCVRRCT